MNRPVRTRKDSDEARARILEAAEEHFRRVGYNRTSVADIAAGLGMSPANIYRFFPSRNAINESIFRRVVNEVADIAVAIARTNAPATEKLDQFLTAVHRHNKTTLVKARRVRHIYDIPIADVLSIYLDAQLEKFHDRFEVDSESEDTIPAIRKFKKRTERLNAWWGAKMLGEVNGEACRSYRKKRRNYGN
jgi:AcrR family transcriptional regulator